MSLEWIITGIILLGGMAACGISLYLKRRKEAQSVANSFDTTRIQSDATDLEKDDSK